MTKNSRTEGRARAHTPFWRRASRTRVLMVLGALLAFDVLFYLLAVRPLDAREREQEALVAVLSQQIEAKSKEVDELKVVVGKVQKARTEGDRLLEEITLLRRTTFSTLVTELVSAATESGVETRESSYDLEPVEGTEQYGMMTITAGFRAPYENLVKFLNRLDRSDHFLIIGSLGATPRSDSAELQITMQIDAFVREL